MRNVRAIHRETGNVISRFSATEVSPQSRKRFAELYEYTCLNPRCTATFHWREAVRQKGNTNYLDPTFVLNRQSAHIPGCTYAFALAATRADPDYIQDNKQHIRLNFPIGGAGTDISPPVNDYSFLFDQSAAPRLKKTPIDSLRGLADHLEEAFGGLEKIGQNAADFIYQGKAYSWDDLFIASDHYESLYQRAFGKKHREETEPCFAVVKPVRDIAQNDKGRPRFACEAQDIRSGKDRLTIRPVIVCENEEMGRHLRAVMHRQETLLVASRPYPAQQYFKTNGEVMIYLAARQISQLARIDTAKYWRLVSSPRHQQNFLGQLTP